MFNLNEIVKNKFDKRPIKLNIPKSSIKKIGSNINENSIQIDDNEYNFKKLVYEEKYCDSKEKIETFCTFEIIRNESSDQQ